MNARQQLVEAAHSLHARGLTHGSTGNISVRDAESIIVTPTGVSLGAVTEETLSVIDLQGRHLAGPKPTKESFLHAAMLRARPQSGAVVHTHSTNAAALSCVAALDDNEPLPPLTAYYAMRVGKLKVLPYHAPGDVSLGDYAEAAARDHHALLLRNHGPIVAAPNIAAATDIVEELEETAKLFFLLRGTPTQPLNPAQFEALTHNTRKTP